ncbi:hypothetical protein PG990_013277 [Apiospora arundinis]
MMVSVLNGSLPAGFSTYGSNLGIGGNLAGLFTPIFRTASREYTNRGGIALPFGNCITNSTCVTQFPAPGFDITCTLRSYGYDLAFANEYAPFNTTIYYGSPEGPYADPAAYRTINTTVVYKTDTECKGNLELRKCMLRLATVNYPVIITDGVATLDGWQLGHNETVEVTPDPHTLETDKAIWRKSMIGGVAAVVHDLYTSQVVTHTPNSFNSSGQNNVADGLYSQGGRFVVNARGQGARNYLTSDLSTHGWCNQTWSDPTVDIVNTVRELMLRSAIAYMSSNQSATVPQKLQVRQTKRVTAYESNYKYLGITIGFMVLQALIISYMLYGWHRLGRDVSLDAFEIARALGAPLLRVAAGTAASKEHCRT